MGDIATMFTDMLNYLKGMLEGFLAQFNTFYEGIADSFGGFNDYFNPKKQ